MAVRVFPGLAGQAAQARRWVCALASGPGGPDPGDLALIATELFANAVLHTRSGQPGGKVTVAVTAGGVVHVHDYGTAGPCPGLAGGLTADGERREEDFGRGLQVVAALSGGLAHLPAGRCPAAGPDDPAAAEGGCCTCCRPGPAVPVTAAREMETGQPAVAAVEGRNSR